MNDKEKQIEEMAKFMHYKAHGKDKDCDNEKCEMCWCSCKNDAEALYNAGYRKLPEDSVVLSRDNYNRLKRDSELYEERHEEKLKLFEKAYNQGSKETAEKILKPLYDACKDDSYGQVVVDFAILERLAKQFGVEIKE